MDSERVLEQLLDSDVLRGKDDLAYTDHFLKKRDHWESSLKSDGGQEHSAVERVIDAESMRHRVNSVAKNNVTFAALYLSLSEMVSESDELSLVAATVVLNSLEDGQNHTSGSPDGFLPVSGEDISTYTSMYARAIVYVWRENCPTCELVREDLEEIFADSSEEIALLSVYGPSCAELLSKEYDVGGGPTVLFFRNGTIDSRTVGALQPGILQEEVEVLREKASPT